MSFFYFEKKVLFVINLTFVTVQGKNYCQIAVPLPNLVHEFFLVYVVFQLNAVDQFKQRAEVGGLNTLQVPAGRVFCENVIKQSDIVEVFRNGHFQCHTAGFADAVPQHLYQNQHCRDHCEEHKDKPHMSAAVDAADHTGCHCKKNIGNIFRVTGNSTIPTKGKDARKAQGTCH